LLGYRIEELHTDWCGSCFDLSYDDRIVALVKESLQLSLLPGDFNFFYGNQ
jgi:hypothetical protein